MYTVIVFVGEPVAFKTSILNYVDVAVFCGVMVMSHVFVFADYVNPILLKIAYIWVLCF
jgi:hypothetical protein